VETALAEVIWWFQLLRLSDEPSIFILTSLLDIDLLHLALLCSLYS
jgi:hypothetical protein